MTTPSHRRLLGTAGHPCDIFGEVKILVEDGEIPAYSGYLDIHLFRYDSKRKEIYILAGDTIGITIYPNGLWEFDND